MNSELQEAIGAKLWELHQALVDYFLQLLLEGPAEKRTAGTLAVIRQFLSDNGVTVKNAPVGMVKVDEYLKELKTLPFN